MQDSDHIDNFEQYLRDQVADHRMYPSDRVWKNIRDKVHTPKKWPALSVFTVLIISGLVIGTILNKPVPDSVTPNFVYSLQGPAAVNNELTLKSTETIKNSSASQLADNNYSVDQLTSRTITAAVEKINVNAKTNKYLLAAPYLTFADLVPTSPILPSINYNQNTSAAVSSNELKTNDKFISNNIASLSTNKSSAKNNSTFTSFRNIDAYLFDITSRLKNILNTSAPIKYYPKGGVAFFSQPRREFNYQNLDFKVRVSGESRDRMPSLGNLGKKSSRFDFRFYATPSISYRKLSEKNSNIQDDKNSETSASSAEPAVQTASASSSSLKLNQKPALGYETGVGLGYKLSKNFTLTGGFQFNISQYRINAFLHKDDPSSVVVNETNDLTGTSSASNNIPFTIKNRYYQLSIPVGIEWLILNRGNFTVGVATSVQPTYTFDKQPLVISSDYKNYTDGTPYVRNWNINANAETFIGYTTGSYRWQIGPQFRYQVLPSLVNKYPNKEHLLNYGLKIGVVKQLR